MSQLLVNKKTGAIRCRVYCRRNAGGWHAVSEKKTARARQVA